MVRTIGLLCLAAVVGVAIATAGTCGIGLANGTGTWCGLPLYWVFGFPPAMLVAVVFGLPAYLVFQRAGLRSWLWFVLGGVLFAVPVWHSLAQPFESPRWIQSGFFDSLNYLGSGAIGGLAFWWLAIRRSSQNAL
jgi:hypothetical protein